jgi:GTPase Era involved in 16S rRNA processing
METAVPIVSATAGAIRRYDNLKLEVAAIAQAGMLQCAKLKNEAGECAFQQLLARLVEDHFNLAVVGPFSRGKSTLMNAILGFNALPTGILPHTSVITTVCYGPHERVLVRCQGWSLPQEIHLDQLEEYVTERGNPENRRRVTVAEIQLPAEMLRHGLHFVDTPGVGSPVFANTQTTQSFLPQIDAAIFVSSFDSALGEADIEFLQRVRSTVGIVFVVLNKLDLVSDAERSEVTKFVREQLDRVLGVGTYTLFAVSAKHALASKLARDSEALAQSGLTELEAALAQFIAEGKTRQLGIRVAERLIELLRREAAHAEIATSVSHSPDRTSSLARQIEAEHAALLQQLEQLRNRLEAHAVEVMHELQPRLRASFEKLRQVAIRTFLPDLLSRKAFAEPDGFDAFARGVSEFCQQTLSHELPLYEAALNEHWEGCAAPILRQLTELPEQLLARATGRNELETHAPASSVEKPDQHRRRLEVAEVALIEWRAALNRWSHFLPRRWLSATAEPQFGKALDQLLAQYRSSFEAMLREAIGNQVEAACRETEEAITHQAVRIRKSLSDEEAPKNRKIFGQLLDRAQAARRCFDSNQTTLASAPEDGDRDHSAIAKAGALCVCPVCRAVVRAVFDHLGKLQYELSVESRSQRAHAEAGGFCPAHTWIYSSLTSPVAISRAYPPLLCTRAEKLELAARRSRSLDALAEEIQALAPSSLNCVVCSVAHLAAKETIEDIFATLGRGETPTLCLPHLKLALRSSAHLAEARLLATASARALARLADAMRRHALKYDAIRRGLMTADERDAPQTALRKLVGDMLLVLPAREDRV